MTGFTRHFRRWLATLTVLAALALLLGAVWPAAAVQAHEGRFKHVLILHSYHSGQPWGESITSAIEATLNESTENLSIHVEYLDSRRARDPEYLSLLYQSLLSCKLKGRPFDIVMLSDETALAFVLEHRQALFDNGPIVFCGLQNMTPARLAGIDAITGVGESPSFRETIELALKFHPDTREIVVLGQTVNPTDLANEQSLRKVATLFGERVRFSYWNDLPLQELTGRLSQLTRGSLVFINGSLVDESGHSVPFPADIRQIRNACRVPLYAFLDLYLNHGIVGGKLASASRQGQLAAAMALRILHGEDPASIPVVTSGANRYMFDHQLLGRFEIPSALLPKGSEVINLHPPFYTLSKTQLWIILAVLAFFTVDLLFVLYRHRRTENALQESITQTKLLLNSAAEGIYGLGLDGKCSFCNPSALRLLGYQDEKDLLGRDLHQLIHHTRADGTPYAAEECKICHAYRQNSRIHMEDEVFWRQDGTGFPVEYWSYPLVKGSRTVGAVISFLDISERRQAEEKLKGAYRELDAFVYTASHDLRTPITVVSGYAELLREECQDKLTEEARDYLAAIDRHCAKMVGLIDDLLTLAKAGSIEPPELPVDADQIVREVRVELESEIRRTGARLDIQPLPAVRVPDTLLAEIFENLIGNALRYAAAPGAVIEVGGTRSDDKVRFYVSDHGPGIPREEAARIFDVFYRGSTGKQLLGSGVGLATVQKIARLYGGRAWVEETPGGGATFLVEINDHGAKRTLAC
jgi:PAS domain S-box-containing protein